MTPVGWEGLGISNATMAAFCLPGAGVKMDLPVYVERVGGVLIIYIYISLKYLLPFITTI